MTDSTSTSPSFHTAPPGWVAIYRGKHGIITTVDVAGFLYAPGAAGMTAGTTIVCTPGSGTLVEAGEYAVRQGLNLERIRGNQLAEPYGGNGLRADVTSIIILLDGQVSALDRIATALDLLR